VLIYLDLTTVRLSTRDDSDSLVEKRERYAIHPTFDHSEQPVSDFAVVPAVIEFQDAMGSTKARDA